MQNSEQIEVVAAAWLAKRDRGQWQDSDEEELNAWLDESTAHRVAYLRLQAGWAQANRLRALGAGGREPEGRRRRTWRAWRPRYGVAAGLLLGLGVGLGWYASMPADSTYRTAVGGLEAVPLPDGSRVTLNTDTEIHVAPWEKERLVNLEHGEAFFDIAADPTRPFVVRAGSERVVAVGTQFSVRLGEQGVRVAVTEGKVRIEHSGEGDAAIPPTVLPAGTVAHSGKDGVLVQEKPTTELEQSLSWRSGFLTFRDTPLSEAVSEFNRYNRRTISIDDPGVAAIRIGGQFRSTNVAVFVRLLEEGFGIDVERHRDRYILHRAGRGADAYIGPTSDTATEH